MSQTVYFNNPASIAQLQNLAGTTSVLPDPNAGGMPALVSYINSFMTCASGTSTGQDLNGKANNLNVAVVGNAFSGQQFTVIATGSKANSAGDIVTGDHLYNTASSCKVLAGIIMTKMIEQGYFAPTDKISTYVPQFSGNGYCFLDSTGTFGTTTVAPNFSTWTGAYGQVNLSNLTVAQAMAMQIDFPYSLDTLGYGGNYSVAAFTPSTPANGKLDFAWCYAAYLLSVAGQTGITLGATGACQTYTPATAYAITGAFVNGYQQYAVTPGTAAYRNKTYNFYYNDFSYCTGPFTDELNTSINCIKSAVVPLIFYPGSQQEGQEGQILPRASYNAFSWTLMQAVCAKALSNKNGTTGFGTYSSLVQYIRQVILAPMNITTQNSCFAWSEAIPVGAQMIEPSFRRISYLATGYLSSGASTTYYNTGQSNALVWASQFKDDGFYKCFATGPYLPITPDINGPDFLSNLLISTKAFTNILIMIANKGLFNGVRVLNRSTINYLLNIICCPAGAVFEVTQPLDYTMNSNWHLGFIRMDNSLCMLAGSSLQNNFPNAIGEQGTISTTSVFPYNQNVMTWSGSSGTTWFLDFDTGNYGYIVYATTQFGTSASSPAATGIMPILAKYI